MMAWLLGALLYGVLLAGTVLMASGVRRGDERFARLSDAVGEPAAADPPEGARQKAMGTDS